MTERRGLGRGLSALIPAGDGVPGRLRELPVEAIGPNTRQPRASFDEQELEELAASIREVGLLQPVVVREVEDDRFELIAGERRLRAAKLAGLRHLPAIIRETVDADVLKEALIENIHRVQLNPLEEAAAYQQLLDDFGVTQEELARRLGKSRPTLSNALRLLSLPPGVQKRVAAGVLSAGHAKALLAVHSREHQERVAERIVAEGLSVRATEELVRVRYHPSEQSSPENGRSRTKAPRLGELEERLSDALMARVRVAVGARRGKLTIEFSSVDDLERIVGIIAHGVQRPIRVQEESLAP
ncbi:MAG: ParB/RepB/Spo0J family partition protein [Actinomycetota bacterium]|nr:ParB/RepB/Spo0J family partition protein [Actinomycetota bacterium]